jgi:hypothetical protein
MLVLLLAGAANCALPAELKPATVDAFDRYIRQTGQRLNARGVFLWADESADRGRRARNGEVAVEPAGAKPVVAIKTAWFTIGWAPFSSPASLSRRPWSKSRITTTRARITVK